MQKKKIHILIPIIFILIAFVLPQEGTVKTYASGFNSNTFKDVKADNWFYSGVKSAYNNGLMDGVSGNYFSPNGNFTLAQAITVAARMHASNMNETINTKDAESWYQPYFDYAVSKHLLSNSIIRRTDISTAKATRSETAFMLYNVLKNSEPNPEAINDSTIPDLNSIPQEYQGAVRSMYKSGIITGMPDGNFNGDGYVTRAQISAIIYRMIDKQERVPYDPKYNYDMVGQEGNTFMYKGNIAYDNDYTYFSVDAGYGTGKSNIIRRNNKTGIKEGLYIGNGPIYNLRLKDGKLYFIENKEGKYNDALDETTTITEFSCLVCYDVTSKSAKCLLKSDNSIEIHNFELYGDAIYLDVVGISGVLDSAIVKFYNGESKILATFNNSFLSNRAIYIYDNQLYYLAQSGSDDNSYEMSIYDLDLDSGESKQFARTDFGNYFISNGILYIQPDMENEAAIYKYNLVTGNDYLKERKTIFYSKDPKFAQLSVSLVEGKIYIGCEGANSIYKLLGDGTLSTACNVKVNPLNFVITGSGEFLYLNFWDPNRAQYYTNQYSYFNGLRDYLSLPDKEYQSAVKSVMNE
ncbi:MAG: S-layer homology domain-containing protein [Aminipila sp.]